MKIEKLRSKLKKVFNRVMGVLLPVATLFVSCGTNALVVHAAESNVITITSLKDKSTDKHTETEFHDLNVNVPDGSELVGLVATSYVSSGGESVHCSDELAFYIVKNGKALNLKKSGVSYSYNITTTYDGNSNMKAETGEVWYIPYKSYANNVKNTPITFSISSKIKIFHSLDEFNKYVSTGAGDYDIIKPDTIDDGVKDPDIGYLHNLQMNQLQTGKQDENGIYELYSDRFTWDDTYPEYDSSYLVEVRGKCVVQTRGFLGFGKTKTYTSDIENIAKDISYKDLEWIISSQDKFAPFNSFINEHMPTNLVMTGVYGMRDLYFRIYKWSDADECYHYGPWVNMHFIDDDVWISVDGDTTLGDFDKDGNFIVNPDSDYGTGKKNDVGVGVGDTIEDAKKDNDRRNEEKKNDDGKLDLSNASISDIWYWFVTSLSNLYNSLGFIPEFFQKIFSFLPTPIYVFLGIGIVVAILLRVLGR